MTRRLRRERWGCRPEGAVLSFGAKESTKESRRHGDYGKKASIAHFDGGARNVARIKESELSPTFVRAPVLTFFRRQNGRAFFPFAAYRRSAPPQLALGRLKWRCLGCFDVAWIFLKRKRPAWVQIHAGFFMRAGGPVTRRRSFLFNWQVTTPNRRAARPVAERR